ncbi:MAG: hypothetical protein IPO86_10605 [Saprospiraceae bacterium]|nr:hypothetical protein [Saprospiraceae bacterium]MBK9728559.1 hypothetical protein [Saprospiraceae bacterium]
MKNAFYLVALWLLSACAPESLPVSTVDLNGIEVGKSSLKPFNLLDACNDKTNCIEALKEKVAELQILADQSCISVTDDLTCCLDGRSISYSVIANPKSDRCFHENIKEVESAIPVERRNGFNVIVSRQYCTAKAISLGVKVLDDDARGAKFGYRFRWSLDGADLITGESLQCIKGFKYNLYVIRVFDLKTVEISGSLFPTISR